MNTPGPRTRGNDTTFDAGSVKVSLTAVGGQLKGPQLDTVFRRVTNKIHERLIPNANLVLGGLREETTTTVAVSGIYEVADMTVTVRVELTVQAEVATDTLLTIVNDSLADMHAVIEYIREVVAIAAVFSPLRESAHYAMGVLVLGDVRPPGYRSSRSGLFEKSRPESRRPDLP